MEVEVDVAVSAPAEPSPGNTATLQALDIASMEPLGLTHALLSVPEAEARASWADMPRKELLAEVGRYRRAIRGLASALRSSEDPAVLRCLPLSDLLLVLGPDPAGPGPAMALPPPALGPRQGSVGPDGGSAGAPEQPPAVAHPELAHLGQEGVDFTVADADDMELDESEWAVPPHCVPIHANVTTFDWPRLYSVCQFDVVMMDPPWQLATANPTRGVALGYSQLSDDHITRLPVSPFAAKPARTVREATGRPLRGLSTL
jgi:hypothetical protein